MAVGTQYTVPETGWSRFEETNANFNYSTGWATNSNASTSGGTDKRTSTIGQTIKFGFTGTSIRIIAPKNTDLSDSLKISIDGIEYEFSEYHTSLLWQVCVFEKIDLKNTKHSVVITSNSTKINIFDAVDLLQGNSIIEYVEDYYYRRMSVKNPIDSRGYSFDTKTLIHLPSLSNQNMLLHGVKLRKEIQLDAPFDKMKLVKDTSVVLGEGKTFTHTIDLSEIKAKKIIL